MNRFTVVDYIVFVGSLLICAGVGIYYLVMEKRKSKPQINQNNQQANGSAGQEHAKAVMSTREYFLGSRSLSMLPVVCSLFASFFSSIGILGLPGSVQALGAAAFIPAAIIVAIIYVPIYYRNKFSSVFEYVEARFHSKALRKITAIGSALSVIAYAAVCAYVPCVAFTIATGIPEWIIIIAAGVVTIFYTAVGGLRAVVAVDTIQAVIMFLGILVCLIMGSIKVGGMSVAWKISYDMGRITLDNWNTDPRITHSFWSAFVGNIFHWTATIAGNQATLQRCCAMETINKAKLSLVLVTPIVASLKLVTWLAALVAFAYYNGIINCDPISAGIISNSNQLLPYFVQDVMYYPAFLGFFYSCLFSGSISTMSTAYNSVSSIMWEDWLRPILKNKLTKRQILLTVKLLSVLVGALIGIVAIAAKYAGGTALKAVVSFTGAFTGGIHAVYFCAAFLPFITSNSLIVGLFVSQPLTLAMLIYQIIEKPYTQPWLPLTTSGCDDLLGNSTTNLTSHLLLNTTKTSTMMMLTTRNTTEPLFMESSLPSGLRGLFTLSYMYFPMFSMFCCLLVAIVISLVTIALSKCFPRVAWLKPHPSHVNPDHLAVRWLIRKVDDTDPYSYYGKNHHETNSSKQVRLELIFNNGQTVSESHNLYAKRQNKHNNSNGKNNNGEVSKPLTVTTCDEDSESSAEYSSSDSEADRKGHSKSTNNRKTKRATSKQLVL